MWRSEPPDLARQTVIQLEITGSLAQRACEGEREREFPGGKHRVSPPASFPPAMKSWMIVGRGEAIPPPAGKIIPAVPFPIAGQSSLFNPPVFSTFSGSVQLQRFFNLFLIDTSPL